MISVIIPTKDRWAQLEVSLDHACQALSNHDYEVIVVNDSALTIDVKMRNSEKILIHRNAGKGVAAARNYGANKARGEWLLFLDDDMLIQEHNITTVLAVACGKTKDACFNINWKYPDAVLNQILKTPFGRFLNHYGFTSFKGWNKNSAWDDEKVFETTSLTSQFLFIKKDVFIKLGGYNEDFPLAGFEDYAFAESLRKEGVQILVIPFTMAYHNEVDRTTVRPWLERRKRGGKTRKVAVNLGYEELELDYLPWKRLVYQAIYQSRELFIFLLSVFPSNSLLDHLYFLIVNALYGAYSYIGYRYEES